MNFRRSRATSIRAAAMTALAGALLAGVGNAHGEPLLDACPAQLAVRQAVAQDAAGWTSMNQQAAYTFVRVAFYPGLPSDTSLIVPTTEYKTASGLHDTWSLPKRPEGYTVVCRYGETTASVSRRLDDDVDFCMADYDTRFISLVVKHWRCGDKASMPARARPGSHGTGKSTGRQGARSESTTGKTQP